ncbi:hypothetical protein [Streptomyces sp. NPDC007883]|uniref:hypothetical protein n=1 Tax=Streptomyces sp. NPDC007883 TaxID=3155116 RepID=UPI0033F103BF
MLWWLCRALFPRPWLALLRYVVVPVVTYGTAVPLGRFHRAVLTPAWHGLAWVHARLLRWVLPPVGHGPAWLYAKAVAPAARGVRTAVVGLAGALVVAPVVFLYRWVLASVSRFLALAGRATADAPGTAWRAAGYVSRAVWRALEWLARNLPGRPVGWFHRSVAPPWATSYATGVWAPSRGAAVEAGRTRPRGALGPGDGAPGTP